MIPPAFCLLSGPAASCRPASGVRATSVGCRKARPRRRDRRSGGIGRGACLRRWAPCVGVVWSPRAWSVAAEGCGARSRARRILALDGLRAPGSTVRPAFFQGRACRSLLRVRWARRVSAGGVVCKRRRDAAGDSAAHLDRFSETSGGRRAGTRTNRGTGRVAREVPDATEGHARGDGGTGRRPGTRVAGTRGDAWGRAQASVAALGACGA